MAQAPLVAVRLVQVRRSAGRTARRLPDKAKAQAALSRAFRSSDSSARRGSVIGDRRGQDLHRTLLKISLLRDRVRGVERHFVDELTSIEEWDKYHSRRHLVTSASLNARADLSATRRNPHLLTAPKA